MTSTSDDQLTHDLLLAQMMEDELFLEELRRHPDFAHYLEAGTCAPPSPRSPPHEW